ncbi:MAG: signal peptidase II [Gammaproteobacteria bacterium HGW-Gammaproteobacteria-14]|nr:MAG: signal peptidase II [Gammaproteobacteria bacterium HGW-Gammaproteobacteria-14]
MRDKGLDTTKHNLQVRNLYWLLLSALVVVLDLWTKALAEQHLVLYRSVEVLSFFNFTLAYNSGAAFSFLADAGGWQRWFFSIVALVASVVIVGWLLKLRGERMVALGLALILGGALGNLWDRLTLGHVVDFLDFHWAGYHFPAFNIADSAITVGAVLLILDMFIAKKPT